MTLNLAKIKSDAETIASRCDTLLMPLPVKDVLGMLAEIESHIEKYKTLFEKIKHGDDGHMRWLLEAIEAHYQGLPEPKYIPSDKENVILELDQLKAENEALRGLLDTPHTSEWFEGVKLEAGHQIRRWGAEHDAGKTPADWFWLIGYLAQKAMTAQITGDADKARHHTISTGAAMLNWFRSIVGDSNSMRPGIDTSSVEEVQE